MKTWPVRALPDVEWCAMKAAMYAMIFCLAAPTLAFSQANRESSGHVSHEVMLSSAVAEKLLIHKEEIQWPHKAMEAHVKGTVVLYVDINNKGDVVFVGIISGPKLLTQPVLNAVRKYKYQPYKLNGKPIEVETTVSVTCQNY